MKMQVRFLALLSGLRIWPSRKLWCRSQTQLGSGIVWLWCRLLLWLWCKLAGTALIQHIAWEFSCAIGATLKRQKKKKRRIKKNRWGKERKRYRSLKNSLGYSMMLLAILKEITPQGFVKIFQRILKKDHIGVPIMAQLK